MRSHLTSTAMALVVGLGAVGLTSPLFAQTAGGPCDQRFSAVDTNNDGEISQSEAAEFRERVFSKLDDNNDGQISQHEYLECYTGPPPAATFRDPSRYLRPGTEEQFARMDVDKDERVKYQEYVDAGKNAFRYPRGQPLEPQRYQETMRVMAYDPDRADRDDDGVISEDEAATDIDMSFMMRDQNGDGELSLEEWKSTEGLQWEAEERAALFEEQFAELDEDGDGKLSESELQTADEERLETTTAVDPWGYRGYFLGL